MENRPYRSTNWTQTAAVTVVALLVLLAAGLTLYQSNRAARLSSSNLEIIGEVHRQTSIINCVLLIAPETRTESLVRECITKYPEGGGLSDSVG